MQNPYFKYEPPTNKVAIIQTLKNIALIFASSTQSYQWDGTKFLTIRDGFHVAALCCSLLHILSVSR